MSLFAKPNLERDKELLEIEKERQSRGQNYEGRFWKAVPKADLQNDETLTEEVGIRILQAPGDVEGAEWNMTMAKHFIRHPDGGFEQFTCMKVVYGEDCVACAEYERRLEIAKAEKSKAERDRLLKEANIYKPTRAGVFNVLGVKYITYHKEHREERVVDTEVKIFHAPISLWTKIISIVSSRGRSSDIFDVVDENGKIIKAGRDIIILYDKAQSPANKYNAVPTDYVELGTLEQMTEWMSQVTPLKPENPEDVVYRVDPEVQHIKTFGTRAEREEMREMLKEHWAEKRRQEEADKEAVDDAKREVNEKPPKAKTDLEEVPEPATKPEPEPEVSAEKAEKELPEPATKEPEKKAEEVTTAKPDPVKASQSGDKLTGLKAKLAKIKNKQDG